VDVIIATGKILSLIESSKTISFIDSIRSHGLKILKISVQDQLVMPGLIDVHVYAIGGGGERGLFVH
jgi:imidazolonepropionase-like amidohydrolase